MFLYGEAEQLGGLHGMERSCSPQREEREWWEEKILEHRIWKVYLSLRVPHSNFLSPSPNSPSVVNSNASIHTWGQNPWDPFFTKSRLWIQPQWEASLWPESLPGHFRPKAYRCHEGKLSGWRDGDFSIAEGNRCLGQILTTYKGDIKMDVQCSEDR